MIMFYCCYLFWSQNRDNCHLLNLSHYTTQHRTADQSQKMARLFHNANLLSATAENCAVSRALDFFGLQINLYHKLKCQTK